MANTGESHFTKIWCNVHTHPSLPFGSLFALCQHVTSKWHMPCCHVIIEVFSVLDSEHFDSPIQSSTLPLHCKHISYGRQGRQGRGNRLFQLHLQTTLVLQLHSFCTWLQYWDASLGLAQVAAPNINPTSPSLSISCTHDRYITHRQS